MMSEEHAPENEQDPLAPEPVGKETATEGEADSNVEPLHTEAEESKNSEGGLTEEQEKIQTLATELAATKDQMLRVAAEAENTKRRALKDREDAQKYANASFAKSLLSVADNLRRALDAVPEELAETEPQVKNLLDGIEATERELLKAFEHNHIKKINPKDEIFNPNFHEVMFETPGTGKPAGTVIEVMEMGYTLHDRLIRPARVGVAKEEDAPGGQVDEQV